MRRALFLINIFIFFIGYSYGEIKTLTLDNVRQLALNNSLDVRQAEKNVKIAQAQLNESYADFFVPDLSVSGAYNYNVYGNTNNQIQQIIQNGQTVIVTNQFPDNYSAGLTLSKTLYNGFQYKNAVNIQTLNLELLKKTLENQKNQTILTALTNFYNLFLLEENIKNSETADKDLHEQMNFAEQNYKYGNTNALDFLKSKLAYQNNQPKIIAARHAYLIAKINLCNELGITNYDEVEFIGNLFETTNALNEPLPMDKYIDLALSNDITLKNNIYNLEVAKLNKQTQELSRVPTITGSLAYKYDYERGNNDVYTSNSRSWVPSWSAGLGISAAIEDWLPFSRRENSIIEYDENVKKYEFARDEQINTVTLLVKTLILQLKEYSETVESERINVDVAAMSLDLAKKMYMLKTASFIDINDSESSYRQAVSDYLQSIYNFYSSYLNLKIKIGESI